MKRVVIVAAKRTPFGRFLGDLSGYSPVDLAVAAADGALNGIDHSLIHQVILGNVFGAGQGMNIARQVSVRLGLPLEASATTINMMCGSGMQAALMAVNAIRAGDAKAVLAGGTESMSQAPLLVQRPGKKQPPYFTKVTDSMQRDGLIDSFSHLHMGVQAEQLAAEFQISREQQDRYAQRSQRLYGESQEQGAFADELTAVGEITADQHPRPNVSLADLSQLKPAFQSDGTVTAGNASGVNDGAAMLLLADRDYAIAQNWPILAEWITGVAVGCEPARMGLGPVHAIKALFQKSNRHWPDIDTLEINEAFAAQVLACLHELDVKLDLTTDDNPHVQTPAGQAVRFNGEGGAIAIGHPLAVSGARLLTHLAWKVFRRESKAALGALCIGGGQGIAAMLAADH